MKLPQFTNCENQVRVLLVGFGPLPVSLMQNLLSCPDAITVVGIMSASNLERYSLLKQHPAEIELLRLAKENDISILTAPSINSHEFKTELLSLAPHVMLVAGWSEIIKPPILSTKNVIMINCHGSLLPRYRGACPYIATIFNGDKTTGFTFHLLDEGIDTGDILFQQEVNVGPDETAISLERRISRMFGESVVDLIRDLKSGTIVPQEQTGAASYVPRVQPEWTWIPWEEDPAVIDQRMRALCGVWPLATSLGGIVVGFEKGAVAYSNETRLDKAAFEMLDCFGRLFPGTVLSTDSEKTIVSTRNPDFVVELSLPAMVPTGESPPKIRPGNRFFSIATNSILKSA